MTPGMKKHFGRLPGVAGLRLLRDLLRGGEARSSALLRLRRPENLFQPFGTTEENRYPRIFRFVRETLGDGPDRRLLSFGCSTGEEAAALRAYFPQAVIRGIDINPRSIAACRARFAGAGDPWLSFAVAGSADGEKSGAYDAIFAMAVFRHGGLDAASPRCDHLIRFAQFERSVAGLARCLRPGGLLIIRHANFRFSDTVAAAAFETVLSIDALQLGPRYYGRDDRLLPGFVYKEAVFRKHSEEDRGPDPVAT